METINARIKIKWLISNTLNRQGNMTLEMNSISNITKNASFQKINQIIKVTITYKILKFRQASNVHTKCMEISLIITTKMKGTTGMVVINSNTVTIMNIEAEVTKEEECTKILFKTIITIMKTREMSTLNNYIRLLTKVIIRTSKEVVIIQEFNNFKVHRIISSIDRVLSMISHSICHRYKLNWVTFHKASWTYHN